MTDSDTIIQHTQNWMQTVIVGLNFCPFAKRELERDRVHFQVSNAQDLEECLHQLIKECQRLDAHPEIETSLLIFAKGFSKFNHYLDLVELANALLAEQGYEGIYQLASFHPDYCFEGESEMDAANYTNRSPYPMLHLIREASLEKVLDNYPDPDSIPARNIALARRQGLNEMKDMLEQCSRPSRKQPAKSKEKPE